MNPDKYKYIVLLVALFSTIYGCEGCLQTRESNIKIQLTEKEIQLEKDLSAQYNCKVELAHSPLVKTNPNEKDADFHVVFRDEEKDKLDSYCNKDTLFLDSISQIIALKVFSIMNYRKNYRAIDLIYRGPGTCDQLIEVPVKKLLLKPQ
jgi:hypothetical protein